MNKLVSASSFLLAACLTLVTACGGGGGGGGGGNGGGASGCRFSTDACAGCIAASCATEADACYGAGWTAAELCNGTASAGCTTATSGDDALKKQTAYGTCVLASCTSDCE